MSGAGQKDRSDKNRALDSENVGMVIYTSMEGHFEEEVTIQENKYLVPQTVLIKMH
jgi:hypothetical protein